MVDQALTKSTSHGKKYRLNIGVFLISGALLAVEILFVRFVSILLYPLATYLVISLAMLGLGTSGGLLSLRRGSGLSSSTAAFGALGFGISVLLAILFIWFAGDLTQFLILLPLALALPMLFGGISLTVAFSLKETKITELYFADLVGAGIAAGSILLGLNYLTGVQLGILLAGAGFLAAALFSERKRGLYANSALSVIFVILAFAGQFPKGISPISPKELRLVLDLETEISWEYQGWSPLARVDVLSIPDEVLAPELPVPFKLVTHDGGAPTLLLNIQEDNQEKALVENTIFGLPYWIKENPKVLIIGIGGGPDLLAGIAAGAKSISGAEVNPAMIELVRDQFAEFTGRPYADPRTSIMLADGRHMLASTDDEFDIIQLSGVDTTIASLGANPNLAENYLYTVEAFYQYIDHLTPSGVLSVSFPNIDGLGLRLLSLATSALKLHDIGPLENHIIVSEMTGYVHILIKKSAFTADEITAISAKYDQSPTSVYFPLYAHLFGSIDPDFIQNNQIVLAPGIESSPLFTEYLLAIENNQGTAFLDSQPHNVFPPTDNWPFFFVFDKTGFQTPNYDTLSITLSLLLIFSVGLTLVPPWILNRRGLKIQGAGYLVVYFACLGLGFIFVEVTLIQKLSLIVGHPSYSLALTLCSLLIASGMGSFVSGKINKPRRIKVQAATFFIAVLILFANFLLDRFGMQILVLPLSMRVMISAVIVALPGFFMGVPFPTGLAEVKELEMNFVPWSWGINATFTTIGTILGLIIALSQGFRAVLVIATLLYAAAFISFSLFNRTRNPA